MLINEVKYMHHEAWTGGKEYIVSALFKYLDVDANGLLTEEELIKVNWFDLSICYLVDLKYVFFQ